MRSTEEWVDVLALRKLRLNWNVHVTALEATAKKEKKDKYSYSKDSSGGSSSNCVWCVQLQIKEDL